MPLSALWCSSLFSFVKGEGSPSDAVNVPHGVRQLGKHPATPSRR